MKRCMLALLIALCMVGCNDEYSGLPENPQTGTTEEKPDPKAEDNIYRFANKAYKVQLGDNLYIKAADNRYIAGSKVQNGAIFYLKPSDLGEYMFYDQDKKLLAMQDEQVIRTKVLADNVRWKMVWDADAKAMKIKPLRAKEYDGTETFLGLDGSQLILTAKADAAELNFTPVTRGYEKFPEAELNVTFKDQAGNILDSKEFSHENYMSQPEPGERIIGYADSHAHLNHFLGSGQTNFVGETFNPLGIAKALKDCSFAHGPEGVYDIFGMVVDGHVTHKTSGYPDFEFWPTSYTQTHQQAYYKWLERSWLAGQRVFVQQMVSNEILCELKRNLPGANPAAPCNDMDIADLQIKNMYAMQDYIDAQCGGPGMGWFRICDDPALAREVISEGKMAVFLALEFDTVFNIEDDIRGIYGDGSDEWETARDLLQDQLDHYQAMGITSIFPVHAFNNGLAGSQLYNAPIFGLVNWIERGQWFDVEPALNPRTQYKEQGIEYSNAEYAEFLSHLGFLLPFVPVTERGHGNAMGLTETGRWLIEEMIDRKLVIEIDHLGDKSLHDVMEIVWDAKYPGVTFSHTDILDFRRENDQDAYERCDIPNMIKTMQLGGIVAPMLWATLRGVQEPIAEFLMAIKDPSAENLARIKGGSDVAGYEYYRWRDGQGDFSGNDTKDDAEYFVHPLWYDDGDGIPGADDPYEIVQSWYERNEDESDDLIVGVPYATDVNGACPLPNFKTKALLEDSYVDWPEEEMFADYTYDHKYPDKPLSNPVPVDWNKMIDQDQDGSYTFGPLYDGLYQDEVTVEFANQVTGKASFNIEDDNRAMAHYGLMPDMVRKLQLCREKESPETEIREDKQTFYSSAFFSSAEALIRMHERTKRYSGRDDTSADAYPSRDPEDWN